MQETRTDPLWAPPVLLIAFAGIVLSAMTDYRVYVLRTSQAVLGALVLAQLVLAVKGFIGSGNAPAPRGGTSTQRVVRACALVVGAGFAGFMIYVLQTKPLYFSVTPDVYVTAAPIIAAGLCLFAFSPPRR